MKVIKSLTNRVHWNFPDDVIFLELNAFDKMIAIDMDNV